ncbi:hypothetical protein [Streptosporangium saharense]|uniref:Uncharacterized protein n=1 Tax=Streptosporangium saharense TaxID=1706840 RepID=A0A7W7QWF4_9ACTN|nr:hypothetical protein [Streptosporangium saharense]MBB4921002.1 hypothetical protein [Streptosporangium saharense]
MTRRGQWPAGANTREPKPFRCPGCGAVSSTPIKHDHTQKPKQ